MSDTPRTDAAERIAHGIPDGYGLLPHMRVAGSFARRLERELTESKAQATEFLKQWVESQANTARDDECVNACSGLKMALAKLEAITTEADGVMCRELAREAIKLLTPKP